MCWFSADFYRDGIRLREIEILATRNSFIADYMINKKLIHVFVSSSKKEHVQIRSGVQKSPIF